jgi:hypothetical protein
MWCKDSVGYLGSVTYEWRIVVDQCKLHGLDLLDLDLEARDGMFITGPIDQDELFARLDQLRQRSCLLVSVSRHEP